ncbi:acyl-CoA/acyl-ACP dehydrogenase [Tropicibacter sp. R15_0]|uniref:acyl-CoA dehydrogenase family protein n=1 Tax=Tropicibacter sp. R15_0 TaxID=2821101 RepID=UPI001ADBAFE0|nr:acyl-CoA dehydrogenase family protein [Tropicibacter sp. R15_0]MBO9468396.1 acyl-CoA/acyl-ACP dehydrogenase [Tropicibacter sp. R15_0]
MSSQSQIIDTIEKFCASEVVGFLNEHQDSIPYPRDLIEKLAKLGLFGINIPEEYGGSKIPISENLHINRVLSKYWLSIPALYGTHLRANQYFIEIGTEDQKSETLPKMASGELIFAHAFHEKGRKKPATFATSVTKEGNAFLLNGEKEWVTNAEDADRIIVVARNDELSGCSAVVVSKSDPGVKIVKNHSRRGVEGVSLNRLALSNVRVEPENIIGGPDQDATEFISGFRAISSLNFSARCVGLSESIRDMVSGYLLPDQRDEVSLPVIANRWSELQMRHQAIVYYFAGAVSQLRDGGLSKSEAHRTKVFCSATLQEVVSLARMLAGGTGYASDDHSLIRQLNDAGSLALIDTPNDTLLTWAGIEDLE